MKNKRKLDPSKALVVFDSSGNILATHHPFLEPDSTGNNFKIAIVPQPGQTVKELEIPAEHRSTPLGELVRKLKVEISGSTHRLTLKK